MGWRPGARQLLDPKQAESLGPGSTWHRVSEPLWAEGRDRAEAASCGVWSPGQGAESVPARGVACYRFQSPVRARSLSVEEGGPAPIVISKDIT